MAIGRDPDPVWGLATAYFAVVHALLVGGPAAQPLLGGPAARSIANGRSWDRATGTATKLAIAVFRPWASRLLGA
jgi:hypothetical protein